MFPWMKKGERELLAALRERGFWAERLGRGRRGFPDVLALRLDIALLIELEAYRPGRRVARMLRAGQWALFRDIEGCDSTVVVCAYDAAAREYFVYPAELLACAARNEPELPLSHLDVKVHGDAAEVADFFRDWVELGQGVAAPTPPPLPASTGILPFPRIQETPPPRKLP